MWGPLLRSELLQLRYRKRVLVSLIGAVLMGIGLPALFLDPRREGDADALAQAQAMYADAVASGQCDSCVLSDFAWGNQTFGQLISQSLAPSGLLMAFVVFMVVIVYVAADFSSGVLATRLTFTPRRFPLLVARCVGAGLLGAALLGMIMTMASAASAVWYMSAFGMGSIGPAPGLLALIAASFGYGGLLGVIAALLVFIFNGPVWAALVSGGLLLINLIIETATVATVENQAWIRFLPVLQGAALVEGSAGSIWSGYPNAVSSRPESLGYHLVVIVLLAAIAVPTFERRDVRS